MNTSSELVPVRIFPHPQTSEEPRRYPELPPFHPWLGYQSADTFQSSIKYFEPLIQDASVVKVLRRYNSVLNDANVANAPLQRKFNCVAWALRSLASVPEMDRFEQFFNGRKDILPKHYANWSVSDNRSDDSLATKVADRVLTGINLQMNDILVDEDIKALHFRLSRIFKVNKTINESDGLRNPEFVARRIQLPIDQARVVADIGDPRYPASSQHIWLEDDADDQLHNYASEHKPQPFESGFKPDPVEEVTPETEARDARIAQEHADLQAAKALARRLKNEAYAERQREAARLHQAREAQEREDMRIRLAEQQRAQEELAARRLQEAQDFQASQESQAQSTAMDIDEDNQQASDRGTPEPQPKNSQNTVRGLRDERTAESADQGQPNRLAQTSTTSESSRERAVAPAPDYLQAATLIGRTSASRNPEARPPRPVTPGQDYLSNATVIGRTRVGRNGESNASKKSVLTRINENAREGATFVRESAEHLCESLREGADYLAEHLTLNLGQQEPEILGTNRPGGETTQRLDDVNQPNRLGSSRTQPSAAGPTRSAPQDFNHPQEDDNRWHSL